MRANEVVAILNPRAGGGRALQRWHRVEPRLAAALGPVRTVVTDDVDSPVSQALAAGHRLFLAAGGDGTVNAVLAALLRHAGPASHAGPVLGAVALGSSNDFHKPVRTDLEGVPCRIDFPAAVLHDVGVLTYADPAGGRGVRHWIVNASVGVAADANVRFNAPGPVLRRLKRWSTSAAIACATLRCLVASAAREMTLAVDSVPLGARRLRNLSVVKNPHFGGGLRYDSPYEPDSGRFFVHEVGAVSLPRLLALLAGLLRGRFTGRRGTRSWEACQLSVRDGGPFAVEIDGETVVARAATFSVIRKAIRLCP